MKILTVVVVLASSAAAQPPSAATVLLNVETFYANTPHQRARFTQTTTNTAFNASKTSSGELYMLKPAKLRFDYGARTFVFDGTTLWVVDHDHKQLTQTQVQPSAFSGVLFFTTGTLAAQFSVALNTTSSHGALVLELTPRQPTHYKQLLFVVDPASWSVSESITIASNGDTNDFIFSSVDLKSVVKPQWFVVSPAALPSYKVVQQAQPTASSMP